MVLFSASNVQRFQKMANAIIEANRTMLEMKFPRTSIHTARHRVVVTISAIILILTALISNVPIYSIDRHHTVYAKWCRNSVAPNTNAVITPKRSNRYQNNVSSLVTRIDMAKIAEISETKCYLDGQKYVKSEAMYPESHSCHSCVCDTGFDNKTIADSPHCSKIDCNIEFHYGDRLAAGCIPIYYKDSNCCPISWRCRKHFYCPNMTIDITSSHFVLNHFVYLQPNQVIPSRRKFAVRRNRRIRK